jgi:ATP-binding cassette, subfamily B, bacterial MsbA
VTEKESHEHGQWGSMRLYRRMLAHAWPYKWMFLISVLGMAVLAATATGLTALMKPLVDEGLVKRSPETIRLIPFQLVGLFVLRAVAAFLSTYAMSWVGRRVTFDIRNAIFAHLLRLPSAFYERQASGTLISKLIFDVEQIARGVTEAVVTMGREGLTVVAIFLYLFYLNWKLTALFLVLAPLSSILIRVMSKRFRRISHQIQSNMGEISQVTQEAAEGQRVVKAFGAEDAELRTFTKVNERNRRQSMRKVAVSVIGAGVLQVLAAVALAWVIYFALHSRDVTAGEFVSYVAAVLMVAGPMRRLSGVNETVQTSLAAAQSAFALLDEAPERDDGTVDIEHVGGRIEYRDVRFGYPGAELPAVNGVSFIVEPGETVAIVGASGSGKTTIASLLPRFHRVDDGAILLDGVNVNDFTLRSLRRQIAIVGQEALLFDDTIGNNIAYGRDGEIDAARLREAAKAAHVLEFAERLPEGLDARVGEKGARLSGGQRQRVAIARALYKNAPILVLDEATSALDTESERLVQAAMRRLMAHRTTLVIAHRLSTVEHAHRIIVLSRGRVIESGAHAELLARDGAYASLYRSQFNEAAAG